MSEGHRRAYVGDGKVERHTTKASRQRAIMRVQIW